MAGVPSWATEWRCGLWKVPSGSPVTLNLSTTQSLWLNISTQAVPIGSEWQPPTEPGSENPLSCLRLCSLVRGFLVEFMKWFSCVCAFFIRAFSLKLLNYFIGSNATYWYWCFTNRLRHFFSNCIVTGSQIAAFMWSKQHRDQGFLSNNVLKCFHLLPIKQRQPQDHLFPQVRCCLLVLCFFVILSYFFNSTLLHVFPFNLLLLLHGNFE